jgi:indole-3-glycerol phosphate synthase
VDILSKIIDTKRVRVERARETVSQEQLREEAIAKRRHSDRQALVRALTSKQGINIIAEFKRRSPSKGVIRDDISPERMARLYEGGGAAAISVLTEEDYFNGSLDDLRSIRQAVMLPILRKDFIFDEYQIYEAAAAGADAILLIVAALTDDLLTHLRILTEDKLGLDALVEVHTRDELERAIAAGAKLIGVNNRDLRTFEVSLQTSVMLASGVSEDCVLVSESGLSGAADLVELYARGYKGFLIGESLMRAQDPQSTLSSIIAEGNSRLRSVLSS